MKQNKTKLPIKLNILIFGLIEELNLMKTENKDAVKNFGQTEIQFKKREIKFFTSLKNVGKTTKDNNK